MVDWFKDWFDSVEYLEVYSHRDEADAQNLFSLIHKNIKLKSDAKILDAACGAGRFSNLFAKFGYDVTAFDLSYQLLQIARRKSLDQELNAKYFRSDIREIHLKGSFDLILNMFTSFGYFSTDLENFSFIRTADKIIAKNGYFIFDYLNKNYVINNLVQKSERSFGNKKIIEERSITNNRVEKKISIESDNGVSIFNESVMMYSKDEIVKGFNSCGFNVFKTFGDYLGNNFNDLESERLLIFFER